MNNCSVSEYEYEENDVVVDALILTKILIRNAFEWDKLNYLQCECWDQISTWLWIHFKSTFYFFTAFIVQPVMTCFITGRLI